MDSLPEHAQVAVVGAGPVGLALATALTHYGVDAVVVDAAAGRSVHSKAAVVHSRTLEVLGEFGPVSDELVDRGVIVPYFAFRDHDRNLLTVDFRTLPTAYPYTLMVPQDVVETVLDKRLRDLGRVVHRSWRVDGLRQDDDGVVLSLVGGERRRELRARYVVGADGVHSTVRDLLGTGFSGARYAEAFFLADVRMRWGLSREEVQLFFSQNGLVVVAPLPDGRHRIVATVDAPIDDVGMADVQGLLDERGPRRQRAQVRELLWSSNFRVSHKLADHYRDGRVFLAGDAAHVHSPAGGQGMNTGIQDAANLAWKLAAVCAGQAGGELLDTYEAERRPVAAAVIAQTHRLTRLATLSGRTRRVVRNIVMGSAGRLAPVRRTLADNLSELAVTYGTGRGTGRVRRGDRSPAELSPLPAGPPRFRLVLPSGTDETQLADVRSAVERRVEVQVARSAGPPVAQLVRPDGYVAAVRPVDRATELLRHAPHGT